MKLATIKKFLLFFFIGLVSLVAQTPYELVELKNPPKQLVQDYAHVFDARQREALENKLVAYNDSTSTQILVLTVESLDGYPLEMFANEIGEKWGVGQKGKDNGIVMVLSKNDRKITIRTGYSTQIHLPPTINKSIIDQVIIPYFKEGNYAGGIDAGVDAIIDALAGKYNAEPKQPENEVDFVVIFIFIVIFILIVFISKNKGSGGGSGGRRDRSLLDDVILMNTGRSIFGGGDGFGSGNSRSSGGGGFGGFGGGSFGGGGASGSW